MLKSSSIFKAEKGYKTVTALHVNSFKKDSFSIQFDSVRLVIDWSQQHWRWRWSAVNNDGLCLDQSEAIFQTCWGAIEAGEHWIDTVLPRVQYRAKVNYDWSADRNSGELTTLPETYLTPSEAKLAVEKAVKGLYPNKVRWYGSQYNKVGAVVGDTVAGVYNGILPDGVKASTNSINEIRNTLLRLMASSINSKEGNKEISELLAKAAQCLVDVVKLTENQDLKRMNCFAFGGTIHIADPKVPYAGVLCGAEPALNQRITPAKTVPTCPNCIAAYRSQHGDK